MSKTRVMKNVILLAMDLNPKYGSEAGVAYRWLVEISKHYFVHVITDARHREELLKTRIDNVDYSFVKLGKELIDFSRLAQFFFFASLAFYKKALPVVLEKARHFHIELIHCITPMGIYAYNKIYETHIPYIIGPVGGGFKAMYGANEELVKSIREVVRNSIYRIIFTLNSWKKYFNEARCIMVGTELVLRKLPSLAQRKAVIVFDSVVDPDFFQPCRERRNGSLVTVCFVGRIENQKGPHLLLRAFSKVYEKIKTIELILVGDGSLRRGLEKQYRTLLSRGAVVFTGNISREDVVGVLQRSDIFCLPSLREPGGTSVLEAMACGLPVIVSDYGGPRVSVTENCGIRISARSDAEYVRCLATALEDLVKDRDKRERLGRGGRERVLEEFSPVALERNILKIYKAAILR